MICFNPCFVGFEVWTSRVNWGNYKKHWVSILVLLDLRFEREKRYLYPLFVRKFQSLFCWIWGLNFEATAPFAAEYVKFQSLFCWIWGLNSCGLYISTKLLLLSFNPCFVGFEVWTIMARLIPSLRLLVSILVLLDLRFELGEVMRPYPLSKCFNPCFVGFEVWTKLARPIQKRTGLFQSLFCWIWGLNKHIIFMLRQAKGVSILVLLDLRFEQEAQETILSWGVSFNPCFVGFEVWTKCFRSPLTHISQFQSLFCWIWGLNLKYPIL